VIYRLRLLLGTIYAKDDILEAQMNLLVDHG
jgi:hypothetical protein